MTSIRIRYRVMWPDTTITWLPNARAWLQPVRSGSTPISPTQSAAPHLYAALRRIRRRQR